MIARTIAAALALLSLGGCIIVPEHHHRGGGYRDGYYRHYDHDRYWRGYRDWGDYRR